MNVDHFRRALGSIGTPSFQRLEFERQLLSLQPVPDVCFSVFGANGRIADAFKNAEFNLSAAHTAGTSVLIIDQTHGRFLISGGGDASVRLWDLEQPAAPDAHVYTPSFTLTRQVPGAHSHTLTSLSIYPFDPEPTTLLSTAYDNTLKLTAITPAGLAPILSFDLDYTPYTHALSPIIDSTPLIAVGTASPAIRLVDLRTGLATHTLPGHNHAVYSLAWSQLQAHILISASADGRVLFFDTRRSNSNLSCLDLDDALGVISPDHSPAYLGRKALDFVARAHDGPVTSVQCASGGRKLVTAGHDQRIRVWDAATGRNELIHFGPRIRNQRQSQYGPLISPAGFGGRGREVIFWPNDDGKGEILVFDMREGQMLDVLTSPGVQKGKTVRTDQVATSAGRINAMAWRVNPVTGAGVEMYAAHGDGKIQCWSGQPGEDEEREEVVSETQNQEQKKKRKRDLVGDLVEGLTKRPVTFS